MSPKGSNAGCDVEGLEAGGLIDGSSEEEEEEEEEDEEEEEEEDDAFDLSAMDDGSQVFKSVGRERKRGRCKREEERATSRVPAREKVKVNMSECMSWCLFESFRVYMYNYMTHVYTYVYVCYVIIHMNPEVLIREV